MPNDDQTNTSQPNATLPVYPSGDDDNQPKSLSDTAVQTQTSVVSETPPNPTPYGPSPNSVISAPAPQAPRKYGGKKAVITMFALALLVLGGISTILLVQRKTLVTSQAWDCSKYVFNVSKTGTVTVQNGSSSNQPEQKADVYINNTKVKTFDVPALAKGSGATLGTVTVPSDQGFTWKVDGSADCDKSGKYDGTAATATCSEVKAYDTNWKLLSADELKSLKSGTKVRFAVSGTASTGSFDKARFTINGAQRSEVSVKKPNSEEFYDEYTIPSGTTNFTITGQIHHATFGWL